MSKSFFNAFRIRISIVICIISVLGAVSSYVGLQRTRSSTAKLSEVAHQSVAKMPTPENGGNVAGLPKSLRKQLAFDTKHTPSPPPGHGLDNAGLLHKKGGAEALPWLSALPIPKQDAVAKAFAEHAKLLRAGLGEGPSDKTPEQIQAIFERSQAGLFATLSQILDGAQYEAFTLSLPSNLQQSALDAVENSIDE